MARLDWDKARRRDLAVEQYQTTRERRNRERAAHHRRQHEIVAFVNKHGLKCFVCGEGHVSGFEWAKTGTSKHGPWAIHVDCLESKKR